MKRIFTTASLALLASGIVWAADEEVNYTVTMDFGAADNAPAKVTAGSAYIPSVTVTQDVDILKELTLGASGVNNTQEVTMQTYTKDILLTANNVGNGATDTYTLTFTAVADSTLSQVKLALLTFNSQGKNHTNLPNVNYTFRISSPADSSLTATTVKTGTNFALDTSSDGTQSYMAAPVYTFDGGITKGSGAILTLTYDTPVDLIAGNTYTMSMDVARGSYATGFFVGLGGVEMTGVTTVSTPDTPGSGSVPEPATATLSLLALAALASRRRRK